MIPASTSLSLLGRVDALRVCLALLVVLNVSRIHQHFSWMASVRPALLLAIGALIYAYLNPRLLSPRGLLRTFTARTILAMAVLACIGAPFGISLGNSAKMILGGYSKLIIGALLLIAAIRDPRDLYLFVWSYVVGTALLVWMGIFVFRLEGGQDSLARLDDLYTYDANDVGVVLLVGLGLTFLVLQSARSLGKVFALATAVGIAVLIARTGSRGAFVGLAGAVVAMLFLLHTVPVWKRIGFVLVTGGVLFLAAPQGYWDQMATILRPTEDYNWTAPDGRKAVTQRGIGYMKTFPVFGLGINNFWRAECIEPLSDKVRNRGDAGLRCTAPHNTYVQVGAELGFPGLAVWLGLVFGSMITLARLKRCIPREWNGGDAHQQFLCRATQYMQVSMVGFATSSFFVSFAWIDIPYILAALMAGVQITALERLTAEGWIRPALRPRRSTGRARARSPSLAGTAPRV